MPCFEELFIKSKGKPIEYNGKVIQMMDCFQVCQKQSITITFEATNSIWVQGILLEIDGSFEVNGRRIPDKLVLWENTAPRVVDIVLHPRKKEGQLCFRNVWDVGDGVIQSWHNGAGIVVEESSEGRRFFCNDGKPDDDFNDLIFFCRL